MKTTIDIPDSLYPQIEAASAAAGQSVEAYVVASLKEQIAPKQPITQPPAGLTFAEQVEWMRKNVPAEHLGWEAAFGTADPKAVAEVQAIIDEEFSKIDPEDWK